MGHMSEILTSGAKVLSVRHHNALLNICKYNHDNVMG